jgi:hypothetical protein
MQWLTRDKGGLGTAIPCLRLGREVSAVGA